MGLARKLRSVYRNAGYDVSSPKVIKSYRHRGRVLNDYVAMRVLRLDAVIHSYGPDEEDVVGEIFVGPDDDIIFRGHGFREDGDDNERELLRVLQRA